MFIKVTANSSGGKYKSLVAVSHIGAVMEVGTGGAQILLKNGDFLPIQENFEDVEIEIMKVIQGEGYNVFS